MEVTTIRIGVVQEVNPSDIATVAQIAIADSFAEERKQGKESYWRACQRAYDAKQEDEENDWPGWARVLADKAGLKETDTIRNHLNAELFFRLAQVYNPSLADIARNLKEYSYFYIAWKHRTPPGMDERIIGEDSIEYQRHITDLLHDIIEAESTRSLSAHLDNKFDPDNDFEKLNKQVQNWRDRGLLLAAENQMPRNKRKHMLMLIAKLEEWWLK